MMIIDPQKITSLLSGVPFKVEVDPILDKALELKGLSLEDVALLLTVGAYGHIPLQNKIIETAGQVKEEVFGKRIVLFAPLYLSNECVNNCLYCGFRVENKKAVRKTLTVENTVREAKALEAKGYKRLLLVAAENPARSNVDYILDVVNAIYKKTGIRILHLNAAPMSVKDLRRLKEAGIGVFQVFQETYHPETYEKMHPSGNKRDYEYRLSVMDSAIEAGFDDLGIGALLGLYDWRFDVLATIFHAHYLKDKYGIWPHTISVPRLRPASGSQLTETPYPVSDEEFKLIVAVYRLAVPTAGVVVSTRESVELRREVLATGASQISAGSKTEPGGYKEDEEHYEAAQFGIDDKRTLDEVIEDVARLGYMPSLCTSCYRAGRTGETFHEMAFSGNIKDYCSANAVLTLKEYILDSANASKYACEEAIKKELGGMSDKNLKFGVEERLLRIEAGERDIYY
ncbi:MAG: [FeFe] hydrogenase H-cluster radical SAM maturase HydG [Deltaproteobacteria bacterium]|nr:[FeFe] hydrogenase H-cluster radical SAM maturase HydG [Deltaproteobacteria bacterium]